MGTQTRREVFQLFKKTHPEVAKDLEAAAAIAGWLPIFGGSKIVKEGIGSAVERAGGALEGAEARGAKEALGAAREGTEGAAEGLQKGAEPGLPNMTRRPVSEITVESNVPELNGLKYPDAVGRLYDSALNPKDNSLKRISLGKVSAENVRRVKEAAAKKGVDIDLSGYTRDMDNYSIRHIHGRHGDPITEARRGQIAVTRKDIARIPEIVETADEITYEGETDLGRDGMLYKKRIDGTVYYLEEVRTKKGTVSPTRLRIIKAGTS